MKRMVSMVTACMLALFALACAPARQTEPTAPQFASSADAVELTPAETAAMRQIKALLTDVQTDYFPATAGCSLVAARLAGAMLDSYAAARPESGEIAAAAQSFYSGLSAEDAQAFIVQLDSVYGAARALTQDHAADYLESAGYVPAAFPWAADDINALFSAVYRGVGADFVPISAQARVQGAADPALEAMMPVLDSVVRAMGIGESSAYLPHDAAFVWNVLYQMGNNHGDALPAAQNRADAALVGRAALDEVAAAAFMDQSAVPQLPKDNPFGIMFDAAAYAYILPLSDTGDTETKVEEVVKIQDDTLDVLVGLYLGSGERLGGIRFLLAPNEDPSAQFPYCVRDAFLNRFADMWRQVDPSQPFAADLDSDGRQETIRIAADEDAATVKLTIDGSVQIETTLDTLLMQMRCYVADTLLDDGSRELYLCGDMASDDYVTCILRIHEGKLQQAKIYGSVRYVTGTGKVEMESVVNVMGTYGGTCRYGMQKDFTFVPETPYTIRRSQGDIEYVKITLKRDGFPVTAVNGGAATTLPAGTELTLAETDAASYAVLSDVKDGAMYRVDITQKPDEWQWYIGGTAESDWFTMLRYAG